jgi:hypothetical protein
VFTTREVRGSCALNSRAMGGSRVTRCVRDDARKGRVRVFERACVRVDARCGCAWYVGVVCVCVCVCVVVHGLISHAVGAGGSGPGAPSKSLSGFSGGAATGERIVLGLK